jgi:hypothetical protein
MAESKFTKGPWRVEKSEAYKDTWRVTADGHRLASLCGGDGEFAQTQANAELMADAPRLLEALRTLHDFALPLRERGLAAESEQAFADARALLEKHGG